MGSAHCAIAFDDTVTTTFGNNLALWGTVVAIFNQAFLFQAITAAFGNGLALWGAVVAIGGDFVAFQQTVGTTFGNGLAEHRVFGFGLWGGLLGRWQCKSVSGEEGKGQAQQ